MRVGFSSFSLLSPPFTITSSLLHASPLLLIPSCIDTSFITISQSMRDTEDALYLASNAPFSIDLFLFDHYGNKCMCACAAIASHAL